MGEIPIKKADTQGIEQRPEKKGGKKYKPR
jgi:hypothetical protein